MDAVSSARSTTPVDAAKMKPGPAASENRAIPEDSFAGSTRGSGSSQELPEWTILTYLNGNDQKIEGDILYAFLYMEEAASPDHFTIVSQLGRAPQKVVHPGYSPDNYDKIDGDWEGVRRYEVRQDKAKSRWGRTIWTSMGEHDGKIDSTLLKDLGTLDMSKPEALEDFLQWGIRNYPAKHFAVVLAGHGNGFLGALPDFQSHNKDMPLGQIADVFRKTEKKTGIKPDVLIMDACLMAHAEAAYELKDSAQYLVASEDTNSNCLAYQDFFNSLKGRMEQGERISPEALAQQMIGACAKHGDDIPTISALNLSHMNELKDSLAGLAEALLRTDTSPEIIGAIIENSHRFVPHGRNAKPLSDYKDLYGFAEKLRDDTKIKDERVRDAAKKLIETIDSGLIAGEHHKESSIGSQDIHGITMYLSSEGFPKKGDYGQVVTTWESGEIKPAYLALSLVKETGWDRVIEKFAGPPKPLPPSNDWF